ncbi:GFA family protein [Rhodobacterales bacterium HKCCE3408]|nr:GFA family protein [Rhodobacterales bacterium HKCCE3408]
MTEAGHCLCGAVRYRFDPDRVRWRAHCHCDSCRRNCSAPFTTFFGVHDDGWVWTGDEPQVYRHSEHAERLFCGRCGTPMAYRSVKFPGEIHFYAASLEDSSDFAPQSHVHWSEHVPWVELADTLPRKG